MADLTEMKAPFKLVLLSHLNLFFWVRDPFENLTKTMGSSAEKCLFYTQAVVCNTEGNLQLPQARLCVPADDPSSGWGVERESRRRPNLWCQRWDSVEEAFQEAPEQKRVHKACV